MTPFDLTFAALAAVIAGVVVSFAIPGAAGRRTGFCALAASGAAATWAGAYGLLSRSTFVAGGSEMHVVLRLDALSAAFIGIIGAVALAAGLYGIGGKSDDERRTGRTAASTACAIMLASLLICLANDVYLFLFAWELLALSFYWAIAYAGTDDSAPIAGFFTLAVTHVSAAALFIALLIMAVSGSTVQDALAGISTVSAAAKSMLFVLMLIGFGGKIGLLPLQGWLPYGYRAAPSVVVALMAGGALNVGFYGILRFIFGIPSPAPLWWGLLVCSVGAVGAILGIAGAAAQRDARTLAAYSSIENAGIIVSALGIALVGRSLNLNLLVGVGIASALVQIAAHALAKCTLFLGCASLGSRAGSTSFDRLGGLARSMPVTTAGAIVAAFSLAAIPPMGGFAGEWLVLESFMQAFRTANAAVEVTFALCAAAIGIAAGIAIVAFVKFAGIGFLGAARSDDASSAQEGPALGPVAIALSAGGVFALGVLAGPYLRLLAPAIDGISHAATVDAMLAEPGIIQPAFHGFSSVSPLGLGALIAGFGLIFALVARLFARPSRRRTAAWTSGEPYRPWTQYGGTGFANPTRVILDVGIRTTRSIEELEGQGVRYESATRPFFDITFYRPFVSSALRISAAVRRTQSGAISAYLTYILIFTILLLVFYPSLRHW